MTLISEIIRSVLFEDVSVGRITDAIKKTYEVEINYHSNGEDIATGVRLIQPVAYGLTKSGNPVIRAFQPYGDTTTKIPSWKFFRVDRISDWKGFPEKKFTEPPLEYGSYGDFNPNGDKTMSVVYVIANFKDNNAGNINNKQQQQVPNDTNTDTDNGPVVKNNQNQSRKEEPVFKTDTEKAMERLRNQLNNPKYISDLVKDKNFSNQNNLTDTDNGPVMKNTEEPNNQRIQQANDINNGPLRKNDLKNNIDSTNDNENYEDSLIDDTFDNDSEI